MVSYEKSKIGKLIAVGAEHVVYRYGDDQVIKFPRGLWYWMNRAKFTENIRRDGKIVKQYFGNYLIEREVLFDEKVYVIIESFINGRHLRKSDLGNPAIKKQFGEIVALNRDMIAKEDLSLEFFGLWGLLFKGRREVANIMVEERTDRLIVIDPGALHFGRHKDQQILSRGVTKWVLMQQRKLLNYYLL